MKINSFQTHCAASASLASQKVHSSNPSDESRASSWVQLSVIVSGIATVCIASKLGKLPAVIPSICWKASAIAIGVTACGLFLVVVSGEYLSKEKLEEQKKIPVWFMSFAFPIVEEVIFRAMIQQGLYRGFVRALPSLVTLSPHLKAAFGGATEEKVAQVGSILFSSLLFGLVHAFNHPQQPVKATFHCVHTATNSALFLGPLYHQHGLWASSLAHIVQNTFCRFLFELSLSR